MKVHISRSEAMSLLVPIAYAWEAGVYSPSGKDREVVIRIFKNWTDLQDSFRWMVPLIVQEGEDANLQV